MTATADLLAGVHPCWLIGVGVLLVLAGVGLVSCVRRVPEGRMMVVIGSGGATRKILLRGWALVIPPFQAAFCMSAAPMKLRLPDGGAMTVQVGRSEKTQEKARRLLGLPTASRRWAARAATEVESRPPLISTAGGVGDLMRQVTAASSTSRKCSPYSRSSLYRTLAVASATQ